MSYCEGCADANERLHEAADAYIRLERELEEWKMRAAGPGNRVYENRYERIGRGPGCGGAYKHGFESAWYGRSYEQIYTRTDCRDAYEAGYEDGSDAFGAALRATDHQEDRHV